MWAGTRLGVPLKTEYGPIHKGNSLQAAIEQGAMCRLHTLRQTGLVNGKAVILARDQDLPRREILNRVVRAVMTKLHLDCFRAKCERQ